MGKNFEMIIKRVEKLTRREEIAKIKKESDRLLSKLIYVDREYVLMMLMKRFSKLSYWDLEEVYDDGCLVLWNKMMDKDFKLNEDSVISYLMKICWNIGNHYLRDVRVDVDSLDEMRENGKECVDVCSIEDMLMVMEKERDDQKRYEMMSEMWEKLSDVDRMILECYYWEGCKMEEIAVRVGYKNANSVKSRKKKVLGRIMEEMKDEWKMVTEETVFTA